MKNAILLAAILAAPSAAEWSAANPQVAEAAKNPRVAGALEAANRFTDVWRLESGQWKLSLRQATIFSVE